MKSDVFSKDPSVGAGLVLLLIATLTYIPVLGFGYIDFDANMYLTDNPLVQRGLTLEGVQWAFTSTAFNWHPITWLSIMLDVELFGAATLGVGHHLTSLLLHLANTFVLYLLLLRLTRAPAPSFFVALFFSCHPMHVGPVAWLAARKDLLSAFFGFASILFYIRYVDRKRAATLLCALVLYALSLMSKGTLVTLPALLIILDIWPLNRINRSNLKSIVLEKVPFVVLAILGVAITYYAQDSIGAVRAVSAMDRLSRVTVSYAEYFLKALFPANLAIYYPAAHAIPLEKVIVSAVLLIGVSLAIWRYFSTPVHCGWLWFLVSLAPMAGFVQLGEQALADRYTYIPYVGLFWALVWGAMEVRERVEPSRLRDRIFRAGALACAFLAIILTAHQLRYWRDSETIFRYTLQSTERNNLIQMNLGVILAESGRSEEAIQHYREALHIDPTMWKVHKNIGDIFLRQGKLWEALAEYKAVVAINPRNERAYNNIAVTLLRLGRRDEAEIHLREALRIAPNYYEAQANLAKISGQSGPHTSR